MATISNIDFSNNILFVKLSGTFSILTAKSNFISILEAAAKYQTSKILIDVSIVENISKSKLKAIDYGNFISKETLSLTKKRLLNHAKIAYLYSPNDEEPLKLGESAAAGSSGLKARAFANKEKAITWLNK